MKKMSNYILWLVKLIVVGLCLWYLGRIGVQIDLTRLRWGYLFPIILASFFCFFSAFILVWNWRSFLWLLEGQKQKFSECIEVYFKAALAKYVPSNVMHYAGRHYYGKMLNVGHATIMGANVLEIAVLVVLVFLMVWAAVLLHLIDIPLQLEKHFGQFHLLLFILSGAGGLLLIGFIWTKARKNSRLNNWDVVMTLGTIAINYVIFFCFSGIILLYLFWQLDLVAFNLPMVLRFVALYSCAWLGGFVTPGAPGGIGVRESIIIFLLGDMVNQQDALVGALFFRCVTVLSELIAFSFASYVLVNRKKM